jgi:hypothetical protein
MLCLHLSIHSFVPSVIQDISLSLGMKRMKDDLESLKTQPFGCFS